MLHNLLRRIHLYSALFLGGFLLLYAATAFIIFTSDWFPDNEVITVVAGTGSFTPPASSDWGPNFGAAQAVEAEYRDRYDIKGRFETYARHNRDLFDIIYRRPGAETKVRFFPDSDSLNVITKEYGFAYLANRLHSFRWFQGGILYHLWALLLELSAAAMILFALSGIWLWYTLKARNRALGWIVLGSGAGYTVGSVLYLYCAL